MSDRRSHFSPTHCGGPPVHAAAPIILWNRLCHRRPQLPLHTPLQPSSLAPSSTTTTITTTSPPKPRACKWTHISSPTPSPPMQRGAPAVRRGGLPHQPVCAVAGGAAAHRQGHVGLPPVRSFCVCTYTDIVPVQRGRGEFLVGFAPRLSLGGGWGRVEGRGARRVAVRGVTINASLRPRGYRPLDPPPRAWRWTP